MTALEEPQLSLLTSGKGIHFTFQLLWMGKLLDETEEHSETHGESKIICYPSYARLSVSACLQQSLSERFWLAFGFGCEWQEWQETCLLSSQKASCFLHKWDPQVDGLGLRAVVLRTWFDRWDSKAAPIPLPLHPCTRRNDTEEQKYTCQTHSFCTALGFPLNLLDLEQSPYLLLLAMLWLFISPRHFFHDWMPIRNSCESIVGHVQKPWLYKIKKNKQLMGASMMA